MTLAHRSPSSVDRYALLDWYLKNRARSRALFGMIAPEAYYERPIPLRHPIVFYEGHLPAFSVNTLIKRGLGRAGIDEELETLFARGIDPEETHGSASTSTSSTEGAACWPSRATVQQFARAADQAIVHALEHDEIEQPGRPVLDAAEGVFTLLEHEAMHQETLLYIFHELPYAQKEAPGPFKEEARLHPGATTDRAPGATTHRARMARAVRRRESVQVPAGPATLGAARGLAPFGWDNEFERHTVQVPAFRIDAQKVTNQEFLDFAQADGYGRPNLWAPDEWRWRQQHRVEHPHFWARRDREWRWRGMFKELPLDPDWPVYVTHAEAGAYARWKGMRLPTEAEYMRAAFGTPGGDERDQPWGPGEADATRGNFDFAHTEPVPVRSYPDGRSAWGLDDLVGNGWEWTSSVFGPFPGFHAMASYPEYSADFFDSQHYVLKGASPATARELVRRSFRNWFRPCYPYVYATFRCVSE